MKNFKFKKNYKKINIIFFIVLFFLLFNIFSYSLAQQNNNTILNQNKDNQKEDDKGKTINKISKRGENSETSSEKKSKFSSNPKINEIKDYIKNKYNGKPIKIEKQGEFKNDSIEYILKGAEESKKLVKGLDVNVKLEYYMSNIIGYDVGSYGGSDWKGTDKGARTRQGYTSYAFYMKTLKTLSQLYKLKNQNKVVLRMQELYKKDKMMIDFLLKHLIIFGIISREGHAGFAGNGGILGGPHNGGYFQLSDWCSKIDGNSIEKGNTKVIYLDGSTTIGGTQNIYRTTNKDRRSGLGGQDIPCLRRYGIMDKAQMSDEEIISLGKLFAIVDPERNNLLNDMYGTKFKDKNKLDYHKYIYMGKELQYMYQLYNGVNFTIYSKMRGGIKAQDSYMGLADGKKGFKDLLNMLGMESQININQYKEDLLKSIAFNVGKGQQIPQFNGYNEKTQTKWKLAGINDPIGYKDIIILYYAGCLLGKYNGTKGMGSSVIDNAYVTDIGPNLSLSLFGKAYEIRSAHVKIDGGPVEHKVGKNDGTYPFILNDLKNSGIPISDSYINLIKFLKDRNALKFLLYFKE